MTSSAPLSVRRWRPRSVAIIVGVWLVLHLGGLFSPGLLDDVDSIYIEIAREMMLRHDYVTPYVDGIRFFDKPPLLYWLAAGSMRLFGVADWAGRLPLALLTLGLLLAIYALGLRLFRRSPGLAGPAPERAALLSALAAATSVGPYLYTRFYIPDVALALWMTLSVHLFLCALDRSGQLGSDPLATAEDAGEQPRSSLPPMLALGAVLGLAVLTKGLLGVVLPVLFALSFAACTGRLRSLARLHLLPAATAFLAVAGPWHVLAALRNPAIPMPPGLDLPRRAGWAWFYLYNEHVARFFSRRVPHDYGQVPLLLFWLLAAVWLAPWVGFLPAAMVAQVRSWRLASSRAAREAALAILLWVAVVLGFFSLSARQEYYSLPALPALALAVGALLAHAEIPTLSHQNTTGGDTPAGWARRAVLRGSAWLLLPLGTVAAALALYFAATARAPASAVDISTLLTSKTGSYNLSLGHLFDLTGAAMGLFRAPLLLFAVSMVGIGPVSYLLRRRAPPFAADLALTASSVLLLLSMHAGLERFYPVLGSKALAEAIVQDQQEHPRTGDLLLLDGELTTGSTLLFYTRQPVSMLDARINGPWFGSLYPDAPARFETTATLHDSWSGPGRIYLLTYHPQERIPELQGFGPVTLLASSGGKAILVNRRDPPGP